MAWSLVTPASRGIGFYLTRHLLQNTQIPVVATARKDVRDVKKRMLEGLSDVESSRLTVLKLDVTSILPSSPIPASDPHLSFSSHVKNNPNKSLDEDTISKAAAEATSLFSPKDHHLHLAFCIPGILYPEKSPSQLNQKHLLETFATNTIGPLLLMKHFSSFLPKKTTELPPTDEGLPKQAIWLNMSARVGSISDNKLGGWYSYRASKAGVNSVTKGFDLWVRGRAGEKAMAMGYHPGTVKTGLSKEFWDGVPDEKLFSPEDAVEKMWNVVKVRFFLLGLFLCFVEFWF